MSFQNHTHQHAQCIVHWNTDSTYAQPSNRCACCFFLIACKGVCAHLHRLPTGCPLFQPYRPVQHTNPAAACCMPPSGSWSLPCVNCVVALCLQERRRRLMMDTSSTPPSDPSSLSAQLTGQPQLQQGCCQDFWQPLPRQPHNCATVESQSMSDDDLSDMEELPGASRSPAVGAAAAAAGLASGDGGHAQSPATAAAAAAGAGCGGSSRQSSSSCMAAASLGLQAGSRPVSVMQQAAGEPITSATATAAAAAQAAHG